MNRQYRDWLARMEAHGVPLTYYDCPNKKCGGQIAASKAFDPEHPISARAECPHCELLHRRVVHHDGQVDLGTNVGTAVETGGTG